MTGYSWDQREAEDADRVCVGDAAGALWNVRSGAGDQSWEPSFPPVPSRLYLFSEWE